MLRSDVKVPILIYRIYLVKFYRPDGLLSVNGKDTVINSASFKEYLQLGYAHMMVQFHWQKRPVCIFP